MTLPDDVARPISAEAARDHDLTRRTVSGLQWSALSGLASAVIQTVYTMVMSRLLAPRAFGLMAIGLVVVNLTGYFAQLGLGRAVIQKPELHDDEVRAAFGSSVGLGLIAAGAIWGLAPVFADLFTEPDAVGVLRALSPMFVLLGLGATADSLLRRHLRFRVRTIAGIISFGVGYLGVGIPMAAAGAGVYSLVGAVLSATALSTVMNYALVRHSIKPTVRLDAYRPLYSFGSRISLLSLTQYAGNNADTAAVGRFEVADLLGQYNRAFYLANLPMQYLLLSASQVLFPSFSAIQGDADRLGRTYLTVSSIAAAIVLPLLAGIGVAADDIVRVLLGPGWEQAASLVPLFVVAAGVKLLTQIASTVAESRGELNALLSRQAVYLVVFVALLFGASSRGLMAYAAAVIVAELVRHVLIVGHVRRSVGLGRRGIAAVYVPAIVTVAVVVPAVFGVRLLVETAGLPVLVRFLCEALAGAIGLAAAMRLPPLRSVRRELLDRLEQARVAQHGLVRWLVVVMLGPRPTG